MDNPPNLKLLERRHGDGFTSGRSHKQGDLIESKVRVGSQVKLRDGKVDIAVRVSGIEGDKLTGEIEEFEGHGPTYSGLRIGDQLTFHETNIFVCIY